MENKPGILDGKVIMLIQSAIILLVLILSAVFNWITKGNGFTTFVAANFANFISFYITSAGIFLITKGMKSAPEIINSLKEIRNKIKK